jgi:hypothetical protein
MSTYCKNCKQGKPCGNYHIYVIDINSKKSVNILEDPTNMAKKFREHSQIKPILDNASLFNGHCLYVGITKQTVEARFKQHKDTNNTMMSNKYVRKYASKQKRSAFKKELFVHLNPLPFTVKEEALAESFEQDYANLLRKLGYAVYSGYVENHEG